MAIDYQKALNFIAQEKYLFALAILDLILEKDTEFVDAYYQRGQVKEKLQDLPGAIADYQRIIEIQPTAKAYFSIALIKFAQDDIVAVVNFTQSAINLDRNLPFAYRLLALVFQKQNKIDAAINNYKKATRCYLDKGEGENARYCFSQIEKLKQSCNSHTNSIKANNIVSQNFLQQAISKYQTDNYQAALSDLNWLLDIDPYHPEALCYRGLIAAKLGNKNEAIKDFSLLLKIEPNNTIWQYKRGIARLYLKDSCGALQDFNNLIQKDPFNPDYLLYRGQAYTQLEKYDNAIEDYDNAVIINSEKGELYFSRGEVQEILKKEDKAIADYQIAANFFLSQGNYQQYQEAQNKIAVLKTNFNRQKAEINKLIRVPIKYYTSNRGSAVVEVVFNHKYTFDLIVDTGATNTTITQKMKEIMQLKTVGKQLCRVGDGRIVEFDVCCLNSLSVQKATINNINIDVATKERTNEGLLGQDFLRHYEVRILKNEIHLYPY